VDAPVVAPDALIRPWRTATIVASLVAAVELVVLIGLAIVLLAKPLAHTMRHHATKAAVRPAAPAKHASVPVRRTPPAVPHVARAHTGVLVLNGNGRTGVAHEEATRLEHLGYRIAGAADARRHDYATTVVMYSPGYRPEGLRLAHDLHVGVVGPLDGLSRSALQGGQLAVILGAR
jgi:hypothetical protein